MNPEADPILDSQYKKNILAKVQNRHMEIIARVYIKARTGIGLILIFFFLYSLCRENFCSAIDFLKLDPWSALASGVFLLPINFLFSLYHKFLLRHFWVEPEKFYEKFKKFIYFQIAVDWIILVFLCITPSGVNSGLFLFFLIHCLISIGILDKQAVLFYTALLNLTIAGLFGYHYAFFASMPPSLIQNTGIFLFLANTLIFLNYKLTTLRYEAYGMYEETQEKLENLDKEKTEYMVLVTHELKAPLGVIQNYVKLILSGYAGGIETKTKDLLHKVMIRSSLMMDNIKDMLQYTNLQTTIHNEDKFIQFEALPELQKIIDNLGCNQRVQIQKEDSLPSLLGVPGHFQILFTNLLSNALKYSTENSPIRLILSPGFKHTLTIAVQDQGIGMAQEDISKLFQPFFRTRNGIAFNPHGTGLGLSICKKIIDLNKAKIQVQSTLNQGSTFTVSWPLFP